MRLTDSFAVAQPLDSLWPVLNDIERIAPLVPGFVLESSDGDTYRGTIRVKVGAISVGYNAQIDVLSRDADSRMIAFELNGRERQGPGTVNAQVRSQLVPDGHATRMELVTDVQVTGRVAQLGMSALGDVSHKIIEQFASRIESELAAADAAPNGAAVGTPGTPPVDRAAVGPRPAPPVTGVAGEPLDLGPMVGGVLRARLQPVGLVIVGGAFGYLLGTLREARR